MGMGMGGGRQVEQFEWRGRGGNAADAPPGRVATVRARPPRPAGAGRVSIDEAVRAPGIAAATVRRSRAVEDAAPRLRAVSSGGSPTLAAPVERVVPAVPAASVEPPLWCGLAVVAQQLAAANASQARARHALERENRRLVAELEDAAVLLALHAKARVRAGRRARWLVCGLSLVVAALAALLLVLVPLAVMGRPGA